MLEIRENDFANFEVINSATGKVVETFQYPSGAENFIKQHEQQVIYASSYTKQDDWYPVTDELMGE